MNLLNQFSRQQYEFVRGSREVLFNYCKGIAAADFTGRNNSLEKGGSIRNLLVHIANTYKHWVAKTGLKKNIVYPEFRHFTDMDSILHLFTDIDSYVFEFIEKTDDFGEVIGFSWAGEDKTTSPFQIFSHVITHEYHHKGQILMLGRQLGYIPVDTDILR